MEKQEETQNTLGLAWLEEVKRHTEALDRQTAALKYLADVIGFNVDRLLELGRAGKPSITIQKTMPKGSQPIAPNGQETAAPPSEPTVEDVRAAMNAFAKRKGKDAAIALIKKYSATLKVEDVAPEKYGDLLMEAGA